MKAAGQQGPQEQGKWPSLRMPDKPPRLISRCDFSVQHWVVPNDCLAFINWPPFHDFPVSVMWGVSLFITMLVNLLITACSASSGCLSWLWLSFPWGSSAQLLVVVFLATPLDSGWSRSLCHWATRKQLLQSICCMPHRPPSHSLRLQNSSLGWSHVSSFVNQNGSNFSSEPSTNRFSKSHGILQVTFLFSVMPNSSSKLFYILTLISPLRVMIYVLEECCIFLWFSPLEEDYSFYFIRNVWFANNCFYDFYFIELRKKCLFSYVINLFLNHRQFTGCIFTLDMQAALTALFIFCVLHYLMNNWRGHVKHLYLWFVFFSIFHFPWNAVFLCSSNHCI